MPKKGNSFPQYLTDAFQVLSDFYTEALRIKKEYVPSETDPTEAELKECWETLKDYIVVSYAIALKENIPIDYSVMGFDEEFDLQEAEEILKQGLVFFRYDENLSSAYIELLKDAVVMDAVEDYLSEYAEVIYEETTKADGLEEEISVIGDNDGSSLEERDYVIENSNSCYLTEEDVEGLTLREINYAKNEIFARLGRKFHSQELQAYFDGKSWYEGIYEPEDFEENYRDALMNDFEKENADFLAEMEYSINPEGYQLDTQEQPLWETLSEEDKKAVELYRPVLEVYAEGARTDFAAWEASGEAFFQIDPNNPWNGSEVCYAFVDLAEDGIPELLIGRSPTEPEPIEQMTPFQTVPYSRTITNCLYAIYGYEDGEIKLMIGGSEWGWHVNGCITADKRIWKKGYYGGGYHDFGLFSVQPDQAEINWDVYMCYNTPEYPSEYCRLVEEEWVLSTEEEYRKASAVTPLEINWRLLNSLTYE